MSLILSTLKPKKGSVKSTKRLGRGNGSGLGTYSGRGLKGQKARKGKKLGAWFEGGQTSFLQRTPKLKGFTNPNHIEYQAINVSDLEDKFQNNEEVSKKSLYERKMIDKVSTPYKILGTGELSKSLVVKTYKISKIAKEKIEKVNGTVELVSYLNTKEKNN
jgi:large subunit ribosomal protein L15